MLVSKSFPRINLIEKFIQAMVAFIRWCASKSPMDMYFTGETTFCILELAIHCLTFHHWQRAIITLQCERENDAMAITSPESIREFFKENDLKARWVAECSNHIDLLQTTTRKLKVYNVVRGALLDQKTMTNPLVGLVICLPIIQLALCSNFTILLTFDILLSILE